MQNTPVENPKQELINHLLQQKLSAHAGLEHHALQQSPLSYAQQTWWLLQELNPGSPAYNRSTLLRLTGELDPRALLSSLNALVERHRLLQVEIRTIDGMPCQLPAHFPGFELPLVDLSHLPEQQGQESALQQCLALARQPFQLDSAPLLRFYLFKITPRVHFLLAVSHHILFDAWSESVFIHDVLSLYESFITGQPSLLPPLPIDYFDAVAWQRDQLQTRALKQQLDYWTRKLERLPGLELPSDLTGASPNPNPQVSVNFDLPAELVEDLARFGRREGCTLFMVMLAAFKILLFRYTGQEDFAINIPAANRQKPEFEKMIGPFLNTLVLRSTLNRETTTGDLLRQIRESSLEAFSNQDIPFERLAEVLPPERSPGHQALFKVSFDFKNIPHPGGPFPHLNAELLHLDPSSLFDLSLEIYPRAPGPYHCTLIYDPALFSPDFTNRFVLHYQNILRGMLERWDQPIGRVSFLSPGESQKILYAWNQTQKKYEHVTFPCLLERQAKLTPGAVALVFEHQSLTYRELLARVNYLAGCLIGMGLKPGQFVLLNLETSLDEVLAPLGVMRARGAYVPVDPAYPLERVQYLLEDSQAKIILTRSSVTQQPTLPGVQTLNLDRVWEGLDDNQHQSSGMPWPGINDLAYMIYTSGSTGHPKGVMVSHETLSNFFFAWDDQIYAALPQPLNISLNTFITFDVSLIQMVMLARGHALYILSKNDRFDGKALLDFIRSNQIDVFECVPAQLKLMLNAGLLDEAAWQPKVVISGGEALDSATWSKICASARTLFYNAYGPTECTVYASACCVNHFPEQPSIGKPFANIRFYVLDPLLQPVPPGVSGELYIGGKCLARGYHRKPELTARAFIDDPFIPGQTIYKTGDKVRYYPDGQVIFLGRMDYQIKRLGYRIEPGEIETHLALYQGIKETLVTSRENRRGENDIVAYLIAREGHVIHINELRDWLRERLPAYMVPQAFVLLDKFPLLENGKLDRKSLPPPQSMENDSWNHYSPPRSDFENELAGIWADILRVERVGIDDDFFELGGYSMLAVQLFNKIRHFTPQILPIATIFTSPTIRKLVEVIQNTSGKWKYIVPIQLEGHKPPLFAVPGTPGDAFFSYRFLSEYLGADRPFYGLQINQMDEMIPPDLQMIARLFIREIKLIQPEGPYNLIGYSWGGHLAYAMACLLTAGGEAVAFTGLLDTYHAGPRTVIKIKSVLQWIKTNINQLIALSLWRWPGHFYQKISRFTARLAQPSVSLIETRPPSPQDIIYARNKTAIDTFHYRKFPGTLTLFRTQPGQPGKYQWKRYCKHLVIRDLPGDHLSIMVGPESRELANAIRQALERIETAR